jgi:hypothetical protein
MDKMNRFSTDGPIQPSFAEDISSSAGVAQHQITVTFSDDGGKQPTEIRSPSLSKLWNEVSSISHPKYPFLDAKYSPSSNMPCSDFTQWVANRLATDDWPAISELLEFTTYKDKITAIRKTFEEFDFGRFIEADHELLHLLKAAAILVYRIGWMGHESGRSLLLEEIYQHCFALYQFSVRETEFPHLLSGANKLIRQRNRESLGYGGELLMPERLRDFPELSSACETLRKFPPTFGACITYSFQRGTSIPGTILLRLGGEYGLRQYGLSEEQNAVFVKECDFFEPASDVGALASSLTKNVLLEVATLHGIPTKKSWKKDRLLDLLLTDDQARISLIAKAPVGFVQGREETWEAFGAWRGRIFAVRPVAMALASA